MKKMMTIAALVLAAAASSLADTTFEEWTAARGLTCSAVPDSLADLRAKMGLPPRSQSASIECKGNDKVHCNGDRLCSEKITVGTVELWETTFFGKDARKEWEFWSKSEFDAVLAVLKSRYGRPTALESPVVQNGYGAQYVNTTVSWITPKERVQIVRYSETIDHGKVYFLPPAAK